MSGQISVRPIEPADVRACERLLNGLPDWFGFETTNAQYIRDLESMPSLVAFLEGEVAGFLTLRSHNPQSSEVHIIAVRSDLHRRGIGRALLAHAKEQLEDSVKLLQLKTLGPSRSDEGYQRTRAFYEAVGFVPLEETTAFWGEDNPTLILVKCLDAS